MKIKRALVSVSDKTGVVEFCRQLAGLGITILSTGGTARLLREKNIDVTDVSDYTGFPVLLNRCNTPLSAAIGAGRFL